MCGGGRGCRGGEKESMRERGRVNIPMLSYCCGYQSLNEKREIFCAPCVTRRGGAADFNGTRVGGSWVQEDDNTAIEEAFKSDSRDY